MLAIYLSCLNVTVHADLEEDVLQLLNKQEFQAALFMTENGLNEDANNPKLLLLKGLSLVRMKRLNEAEKHYQDLKQSLTNNPEPSNNLGMVYRMQSKFQAAIAELRQTIEQYPDYALAYSNLGDTYIALAEQQYQKGASKTGSALLKNKLSLSRNFHTLASKDTAPTQTVSTVETKQAPAQLNPLQTSIMQRLETWSKDWTSLDAGRYLSNYSKQFISQRGLSYSQWAKRKKRVITKAGAINLQLNNIRINQKSDNHLTATFTQIYQSKNHQDTSTKTLDLKLIDNKWLITKETSIDA